MLFSSSLHSTLCPRLLVYTLFLILVPLLLFSLRPTHLLYCHLRSKGFSLSCSSTIVSDLLFCPRPAFLPSSQISFFLLIPLFYILPDLPFSPHPISLLSSFLRSPLLTRFFTFVSDSSFLLIPLLSSHLLSTSHLVLLSIPFQFKLKLY